MGGSIPRQAVEPYQRKGLMRERESTCVAALRLRIGDACRIHNGGQHPTLERPSIFWVRFGQVHVSTKG